MENNWMARCLSLSSESPWIAPCSKPACPYRRIPSLRHRPPNRSRPANDPAHTEPNVVCRELGNAATLEWGGSIEKDVNHRRSANLIGCVVSYRLDWVCV